MLIRGNKSNRELCYLLCSVSVGTLSERASRVYRTHYKKRKKKRENHFFFVLYINCKREKLPVQYILSVIVFHMWVSISRQWRWCRDGMSFFFHFSFFHVTWTLTSSVARGTWILERWPRVNMYFSMFSHKRIFVLFFYRHHCRWWCCPATVAELWDASECGAEGGLTKCCFLVIFSIVVELAALISCHRLWWLYNDPSSLWIYFLSLIPPSHKSCFPGTDPHPSSSLLSVVAGMVLSTGAQ